MIAFHALAYALLLALVAPIASPAPSMITARGQLLVITNDYLVFTTGDAVGLNADASIAPRLRLGEPIVVRLDTISHRALSVQAASGNIASDEINASALPKAYIVASPGSTHSGQSAQTGQQAKMVTVRFVVHTPDDTPVNDDIYLSTDRSNFSPAELKMNRIDAHRWSVTLPLVAGTTIHYQYTRGNYATVERDAAGGSIPPRALEAHEGLHSNDNAARWADTA